jgi:excisionase family DNA binding protein
MSELPNKALFRPEEAADFLQMPIKTLYGLISEGKVAAVRLEPTKLIRIRRETIENMLQPVIK